MNDIQPDIHPKNCISLADAFFAFLSRIAPHLGVGRDGRTQGHALKVEAATGHHPSIFDQQMSIEREIEDTERKFRLALSNGEIVAEFQLDDTKRQEINRTAWQNQALNAVPGFWKNYVDGPGTGAIQGPDTRVGPEKRRAPIFFEKSKFNAWIKSLNPQLDNGNVRKKTSPAEISRQAQILSEELQGNDRTRDAAYKALIKRTNCSYSQARDAIDPLLTAAQRGRRPKQKPN